MSIVDQIPPAMEWRVYRGDSSTLSLFIYDEDDNAVDMGGFTVFSQIREQPESDNVIATMSVGINENLVALTIDDTTILPEFSYFDVEVNDLTGAKKTIVKGTIIKEWDVSR